MTSRLAPLIEKEIKDLLRDPRIYIGLIAPLIMLPLMGFAFSFSTEAAMQVIREGVPVAVVDFDGSSLSEGLAEFLSMSGIIVTDIQPIDEDKIERALQAAEDADVRALIVIPRGFSDNISHFDRTAVQTYYFVKSAGLGETGVFSVVDNAVKSYSELVSLEMISEVAPDAEPANLKKPIDVYGMSVVSGQVLETSPESLMGQILTQSLIVPITLLIVTIVVTQIAATATAVENEERTLETLLTFPVGRYEILLAKLIGSTMIAVIGAVLYMVGYVFYLKSMLLPLEELEPTGGLALIAMLPQPPPEAYIILAANILFAILFTTSLGVVIGALSSDVRISNSLLGVVIVPVMIPAFIIMYGGEIGALPLAAQVLVYALPTSYPMISSREILLGSLPIEAAYGVPYSALLTLTVIYLTGKMLAPEKLLTLQYKITRWRIRRERRASE